MDESSGEICEPGKDKHTFQQNVVKAIEQVGAAADAIRIAAVRQGTSTLQSLEWDEGKPGSDRYVSSGGSLRLREPVPYATLAKEYPDLMSCLTKDPKSVEGRILTRIEFSRSTFPGKEATFNMVLAMNAGDGSGIYDPRNFKLKADQLMSTLAAGDNREITANSSDVDERSENFLKALNEGVSLTQELSSLNTVDASVSKFVQSKGRTGQAHDTYS
jgi:hypothetical protein